MASVCRSCARPIVWAKSSGDRWIPLDADPVPGGNLKLDKSEWPPKATVKPKGEGYVQMSLDDEEEVAIGYVSHFMTCPDAGTWRKNGERSE